MSTTSTIEPMKVFKVVLEYERETAQGLVKELHSYRTFADSDTDIKREYESRGSSQLVSIEEIKPKQAETERLEAIAKLREWIKPGDTVYTVMRHVSASGMSRSIDLYVMSIEEGKPMPFNISYWVKTAIEAKIDPKNGGIKAGGCGMDMGFHLVYSLARTLWPHGHKCTGRNSCPSNAHVNGDREYKASKVHSDGGYAIRHSWM